MLVLELKGAQMSEENGSKKVLLLPSNDGIRDMFEASKKRKKIELSCLCLRLSFDSIH